MEITIKIKIRLIDLLVISQIMASILGLFS